MPKHYTLEDKLKIIDLYNQVYGCSTISHMQGYSERQTIRIINRYRQHGYASLLKQPNIKADLEFKQDIVRSVLEKHLSCEQVALQNGVSISAVESWVRKVRSSGYDSLSIRKPRGRSLKSMGRPKKKEPQTELELLQQENERLRTEVALLKKEKALVEKREAQLKELVRKPSKN